MESSGTGGPLISILTPSFNQIKWLADNLQSVACQSYPHIEHIVIDGGSTDGSVELLAQAGPGVRWRSESDEGQADALNKAFRKSRGEIIGWINSDYAYFDRRTIDIVVAFFAANPEVDMVYGHAAQVNADGLILHMMWAPRFSMSWFKLYDFIFQSTVFMRRRALGDRLVDRSLHFAMDYELWLRLAARKPPARIDLPLAIDRVQPGRKSITQAEVMIAENARLAEEHGLVRPTAWTRKLESVLGIASRVMGVRLVGAVDRDLAFSAVPTTRRELLKRQLLTRRRDMPVEGV